MVSIKTLESQRGPFKVVRNEDLVMTTRNGVALRADVYRPEARGAYPVLVRRTPGSCGVVGTFGQSYGASVLRRCTKEETH